MDAIIKRISERLAEQSSRRGFFSKVGTAVLGAAALATGQGFLAQTAEAASIKCCTGTPCSTSGCNPGSSPGYHWLCGGHFGCQDCYDSSGTYVCTYVYSTR